MSTLTSANFFFARVEDDQHGMFNGPKAMEGSGVPKYQDIDLDSVSTAEPQDSERFSFASSSPLHQASSEDVPLIIFDWDDTLMPTTFLKESVEDWFDADCEVPDEFHARLVQHGHLVEDVLRLAAQCGRIAVVSLAEKPWIFDSAERFLPGMDLPELCEELGISVYYARDFQELDEDGVLIEAISIDDWTALKQQAFGECISEAFGGVEGRLNLLSIGDSVVEQEAAQDAARFWIRQLPSEASNVEPLCKTVKFMDWPSLLELGDELREISNCLPKLVEWSRDVHLDVESPEEIGRQADKLLRPWSWLP